MSFDEWLEYGVIMGWCSKPACATHDGIPRSDDEEEEWENGFDPCEHVLRLWPDGPPEFSIPNPK